MKSKNAKDDTTPSPKPRRRLNAAQKRALKTARLAIFLKEVGRKAQKGVEPNDRRDSYDLGDKIRKISPEQMDQLMREDEDIVEWNCNGSEWNWVALAVGCYSDLVSCAR